MRAKRERNESGEEEDKIKSIFLMSTSGDEILAHSALADLKQGKLS